LFAEHPESEGRFAIPGVGQHGNSDVGIQSLDSIGEQTVGLLCNQKPIYAKGRCLKPKRRVLSADLLREMPKKEGRMQALGIQGMAPKQGE
jgi:hypothetical protein